MRSIKQYKSWSMQFAREAGITEVVFGLPGGGKRRRRTFEHQPARLEYDRFGYESIRRDGEPLTEVRFTPDMAGIYTYTAIKRDGTAAETGQFRCEPSDHPGYVGISGEDPRYFAYTDGTSYCPIGVNLCYPIMYALPASDEFYTGADKGTLGLAEYRRWFGKLKRSGGNFARIWLSVPYFEVETETAGVLDEAKFARLDALLRLADECSIKLKLTFEHFRTFEERPFVNTSVTFMKRLRHPDTGLIPASMDEWFQSDEWQRLWLRKIEAYMLRYGDHPAIMAWELWNEINCCEASDWRIIRDWTERTIERIRSSWAPRHMLINSLGSHDAEERQRVYDDFRMDALSYQQVHRYLDLNAQIEVCRTEPALLAMDAVRRVRRPDRPVVLAETGAVNENHTGPFRLYRMDDENRLFFDLAFAPFFAGAAGPGQHWYWADYIDQKDGWRMLAPFARMMEGVALHEEQFESVDCSTERLHVWALRGRRHVLMLVRDKRDRWQEQLLATCPSATEAVSGEAVVWPDDSLSSATARFHSPWDPDLAPITIDRHTLALPDFRIGCMIKIAVPEGG